MEYTSFVDFKSTVDPSVTYVLRKMSHGRRIQLNQSIANTVTAIAELESQVSAMNDELTRAAGIARTEPCTCSHKTDAVTRDVPEGMRGEVEEGGTHIQSTGRCLVAGCHCRRPVPDPTVYDAERYVDLMGQKTELVINDLYPKYIRWGVKSITGLVLDGQPATVDTLIECAAESLVAEVGREIQRIINMSQEEILGFKLPSTSGAPMVGQTSDTSAPPVSATVTTEIGIVNAISPTR